MKVLITLLLLGVAVAAADKYAHRRIARAIRVNEKKEDGEMKTSIFEGLGMDDFIDMKPLPEEAFEFMVKPLNASGAMFLASLLNRTKNDMMDIGRVFMEVMAERKFEEMKDLQEALGQVGRVVMEKDIDLVFLNDVVDGMLVQAAVISGTNFPELEDKNERGCIDMDSDKKSMKELACILQKAKWLAEAIEIRSMMTWYFMDFEVCDSVFQLFEMAPCAVDANVVAQALVEQTMCVGRMVMNIFEQMDPERPRFEGEPEFPLLPVPRLIMLKSLMGALESLGMYMSCSVEAAGYFMHVESEEKARELRSLAEAHYNHVARK